MRAENFLPQLGLSFSDLQAAWTQYAPTIRSEAEKAKTDYTKYVAPQLPGPATQQATTAPFVPSSAPAPAPPLVVGPSNMAPAPALQKSSVPAMIAAVIGVGLLGGGGYYLWKSGFFKKVWKKR